MVTVAHIVEKIVRQKPFLQEALARGIINNAALAESLIPQIEQELGKKVNFSAVNMAIRRLSEKLKDTFIGKVKFDRDSDISIRSDLVEITFYITEGIQSAVKKMYEKVDYKKGDFLTITQGLHEIMVITNLRNEKRFLELAPKSSVRKRIPGVASITINIPEQSVETIGLFYTVTRALNWENINIIDIVSTLTELTFIIREEDVPRAFNTLKGLIEKNK